MAVADGQVIQSNSVVEVNPLRRDGAGVLRREIVPAEHAVPAGSYAANGAPAAGDGGEGHVGKHVDCLASASSVADDSLPRLAGDDAADDAGVSDGEGGAGAEGIAIGDDEGDDDNGGESNGYGERGG